VDLLDPVDSMRLRATLEAMRAQREAKEQALAVAELRAAEAGAAPPTPEVDLAPLPVSPGHLQQLAGAVKTMVSRLTANKVRPTPSAPPASPSPRPRSERCVWDTLTALPRVGLYGAD